MSYLFNLGGPLLTSRNLLLLNCSRRVFCINQPKRCAGHSHWQNVRHTKEANDKVKNKISSHYVKAVQQAIRIGGGVRDPKVNERLASVLAEAKGHSVPSSTLDRAMELETVGEPSIIEVQASGGLFILIESRARRVNLERQFMSALVKKFGCSVLPGSGSIVKEFFDHTGLIIASGGPRAALPGIDIALDLGIEVGAKDVEKCPLADDAYQFYCEPNEVLKLRDLLEGQHHLIIIEAQDIYRPKVKVPVSKEVRDNLEEMYGRIRINHGHVERIFDNVIWDT